jgi:3-hydroxyisobutyrate dehydrogenase
MRIGWIGLGNMGIPMAGNLLKAGYQVTIYNRSKDKALPLLSQGALWADKPSHLWNESDVVISMVSDDEAVKAIYKQGVMFDSKQTGKIAIDMSTVSPDTSKLLAKQCGEYGIPFLDAPVSGSVQPAREGKLLVLAGGEKDVFEKVLPIFEVLGKMALYLGPTGSGSNAKLAINLLLGITVQGIAESVLFAEKKGIKKEDMLTIINESAVGTAISRGKTPSILADEFPAAFALKHAAKDLRLANEAGAGLPVGQAAHQTYQAALNEGLGELDLMAVLQYLQKQKELVKL